MDFFIVAFSAVVIIAFWVIAVLLVRINKDEDCA